jgi:hypothetical protein
MPEIRERIKEIAAYRAGWFDGQGEAFDPADLELAEAFLYRLCANEQLDQPYIYASVENALSCEWTTNERHGEVDMVLVFDFAKRLIRISATEWEYDYTLDFELDLKLDSGLVGQAGLLITTRCEKFENPATDTLMRHARALAAEAEGLSREERASRMEKLREEFLGLDEKWQRVVFESFHFYIRPFLDDVFAL